MPAKKRARSRKSGKYTPIIWLITGALIAFFISYSGSLKNIRLPKFNFSGVKNTQTNAIPAIVTNFIPITVLPTNTLQVKTNAQAVKTNAPAMTNRPAPGAQNNFAVKIFLANQKGKEIILLERTVFIPKGPSVLKDTLEALVRYRNPDALNMVPMNTRIRKIWIKDNIAYIDFNDDFSYNSYGMTGYKVQVYQVVYTAAQFEQVKAVYFYIDGKPAEYLGGDGYPLHNPIYPFSSLPKFPLE